MIQISLERTYDTEKTSGLEHGTAISQEADDEREGADHDKNKGDPCDDIGIRFVLQNKKALWECKWSRWVFIVGCVRREIT